MKSAEQSRRVALPAHVLLLEDDSALSTALISIVGCHLPTIRVSHADSVEQAWGVLDRGRVDLVITDLHLPGLDGIAFIRRIRVRGWQRPVIVISGYGLDAVTEVREMLQISAVVAKPFEVTALLICIAAALHGRLHAGTNRRYDEPDK